MKHVVQKMRGADLSDSAFDWKTLEPKPLDKRRSYWTVILLDGNGDQTDDDFSIWETEAEAIRNCEILNKDLY